MGRFEGFAKYNSKVAVSIWNSQSAYIKLNLLLHRDVTHLMGRAEQKQIAN